MHDTKRTGGNQMPQHLLNIAYRYVVAGLSVIPIRADGSKMPDIEWKIYQVSVPPFWVLKEWFEGGRVRGIGIPCGEASGNLEVIDFDAPDLWPVWVDLVKTHRPGMFERLVISKTPSGGRHVLYRCKEIGNNQKLAMRAIEVAEGTRNAKRDGDRWIIEKTLIETRGRGGQVVAPGSPLCVHSSGKPYRWVQGRPESIPTVKPETRELMLGFARALNEHEPKEEARDRTEYKKVARKSGKLRPGDDFNERGDVEQVLLNNGWTISHRQGQIVYFSKPGKRSRGHNATLHAVAPNWFYCFSTSASPFDHQRGYSAFKVYALLEYGGDYKAAAKALREQGYGSQEKKVKVILAPRLEPVSKPKNTLQIEFSQRPQATIQLSSSSRPAVTTLLGAGGML
jgi:hypothetical protein